MTNANTPNGASDLVSRIERLHVAVISDSLDRVGVRNCVLPPAIRPLLPGTRTAGRAMTVKAVPVDETPDDPMETYRGIARAVEALQPGDVMVVSTCHHGSFWGELMATASTKKGAAGVVADAYARDFQALVEMEFPTFVAGINAQDSVGRMDVESVNVEIQCGGVKARPGDLVLADNDGVVIVPSECAEEVVSRAEEKYSTEDVVRDRLRAGMSITDAVATYGIL